MNGGGEANGVIVINLNKSISDFISSQFHYWGVEDEDTLLVIKRVIFRE